MEAKLVNPLVKQLTCGSLAAAQAAAEALAALTVSVPAKQAAVRLHAIFLLAATLSQSHKSTSKTSGAKDQRSMRAL